MDEHMLAAQVDRYGPPEAITVRRVPIPEPKRGHVLVRVDAAAVTSGDARIRGGSFPRGFRIPARLALGLRSPRASTPGVAFSGTVARTGEGVNDFSVGQAVAGMTGAAFGAHAQFLTVSASAITHKPDEVSHADAAAALFGGSTALHFLRDRARVQSGHTVLVNGASGSVGSAAVQLATLAGAHVTGVSRTANHSLVLSLGAQRAIDYTTQSVASLTEQFDIVFDAVGNVTRAQGLGMTAADGVLVLAVASLADTIRARGRVAAGTAPERPEIFADLLRLVADGTFNPLTEVVGGLADLPEAHRRIDSGRKVGNLVILPQADATATS